MSLSIVMIGVAPFVGSFLGTVIQRYPEGRPLVVSRSKCDACHHNLSAFELIPVVSYAMQVGRCRHCRERISVFHLHIELAAAAIAIVASLVSETEATVATSCLLGWMLLLLSWIDWNTMILPDLIVGLVFLSGLVVVYFLIPEQIVYRLAASIAGFGILYAIRYAYFLLRGREGLGLGDAKLLGAICLWVPIDELPLILSGATASCLTTVVLLMVSGRRMTVHTAVPFGPFLAFAGWWAYVLSASSY